MNRVTRRSFLAGAAAGAGLALAPGAVAGGAKNDDLNVAIIGAGDHGRQLIFHCMKVPGLRLAAASDIWPFNLQYASRLVRKYKHPGTPYADYRDMLAKEKGLDAVIIASPDWMHAEQTIACLRAGIHVYCEKEMSNTLDGARRMVQAARQTGKLLQIGRQHRSNPRYLVALELIDKHRALGRITHVAAQWHGHKRDPIPWPAEHALDEATLKKYGYDTMERLRNWRWFEQYSAGPIGSLGSHQIDVFNWFLHARPKSVYAAAGLDYYNRYEYYDNLSCVYEWTYAWQGKPATVRGNYEILNTTEIGGFYETFSGDEGTLAISEIASRGGIWRDRNVPVGEWEKGMALAAQGDVSCRHYAPLATPPGTQPVYWHHLVNFFDAVRGKGKLNCPPEVGYETAVSALRVNEAIKTGKRIDFAEEDFKA